MKKYIIGLMLLAPCLTFAVPHGSFHGSHSFHSSHPARIGGRAIHSTPHVSAPHFLPKPVFIANPYAHPTYHYAPRPFYYWLFFVSRPHHYQTTTDGKITEEEGELDTVKLLAAFAVVAAIGLAVWVVSNVKT